ncbi:putative necrosis-inducing factor domain-containing protein [Neurospora intermedia]|uniref:Necrosis-inducing factor domain-containing protein n=1 Tax=Neurospora intermedia TaxID=5142 RepID=A0ABR3D1N4_NEUIN
MILTTLLALFALAATTTTALPAAEVSSSSDPLTNATLTTRDDKHWACLNFSPAIDQSSGGSPKWGDCLQLRANIESGGSWTFWSGRHTAIASYGTCVIGVETTKGTLAGTLTQIGNIDLIQIVELTEAMIIRQGGNRVVTGSNGKKWVEWNAKVGSKGTMECFQLALKSNKFAVNWGLYHT